MAGSASLVNISASKWESVHPGSGQGVDKAPFPRVDLEKGLHTLILTQIRPHSSANVKHIDRMTSGQAHQL